MKKVFIATTVFILSLSAGAQPVPSKNPPPEFKMPDFKIHKEQILTSLNQALENITKQKDCISKTNSNDDIKKCMEAARAEHEARMKKINPNFKMGAPVQPSSSSAQPQKKN